MKKTLLTSLLIAICLSTSVAFGQSKRLKVEIENISIKAPENWLVNKTEKEMSGFKILLYNQENINHVTIECIKKSMNLEAAIVDASSEKSLKTGFEYMIIEKVKSSTLNKYQGKFLEYTNSPLRDYFRGGFYGIIDNGYTYIIDYFSEDTPEGRNEVAKIINSINILKPESRPNFFEVEKEYLPENVKLETKEESFIEESEVEEQKTQQNEVEKQSTIKDTPKKEKKSILKKMTSIFNKKEKKEELNNNEEKSKNFRPKPIGKTKTKYQNQAKKQSNNGGKSFVSNQEKVSKAINLEKAKPTNVDNKLLTDKSETIAKLYDNQTINQDKSIKNQTIKQEKAKPTNIDNKSLTKKSETIAKTNENQSIKQDKLNKENESFWSRLATTLMGEKVEDVKPNNATKQQNITNPKLQDNNQSKKIEDSKPKESFWSRLATTLMGEKIDTTKKTKTK